MRFNPQPTYDRADGLAREFNPYKGTTTYSVKRGERAAVIHCELGPRAAYDLDRYWDGSLPRPTDLVIGPDGLTTAQRRDDER